jgi:homogentisate 1,2-dioxygenase
MIILLSTQHNALALDNPTYDNGMLVIPSVDTLEQVGRYRNIRMALTGTGTWTLRSYIDTLYHGRLTPQKVDLITTTTLPKRVYLHLEGPSTCMGLVGKVVQRVDNNVFNIVVNVDVYNSHGDAFCMNPDWTFHKTIELPVLGLKAGTYAYTVNGTNKGSFTLDVDNNLPGYPADVTWSPSIIGGRPETNEELTFW